MRRLALLVIASSCAAPQTTSTIGRAPVHQVGASEQPTRKGESLLTLAGGPLLSPVIVPLWFDLTAASADEGEKCSSSYEVSFFELVEGGIYVEEHNPYCGGAACRILDDKTLTFIEPEGGCIPPTGMHSRIESWGRGVVVVRSDTEGIGTAVVGSYSRDVGFRAMLSVDLGHAGTLEGVVTDAGVELRSRCPLLDNGCGANTDLSNTPVRTYVLNDGKLTLK